MTNILDTLRGRNLQLPQWIGEEAAAPSYHRMAGHLLLTASAATLIFLQIKTASPQWAIVSFGAFIGSTSQCIRSVLHGSHRLTCITGAIAVGTSAIALVLAIFVLRANYGVTS